MAWSGFSRCGLVMALSLLLGACASQSPTTVAPAAPAQADPQRMVATIRAAGTGNDELNVQPLRDPMVEDLRQTADSEEKQGNYAEAAAALDHALTITPNDPAVIQERAEAAVLLKDFTGAEQRAKQAYELGSRVGPLCRRHWATVRAVRFAQNDGVGATEAKKQMDGCKVEGPSRY